MTNRPNKEHLERDAEGKTQATKSDSQKIRMGLLPIRAKIAVGRVFTYGAFKYSEGNWHAGNGFDWSRLMDASERHMAAFESGEDYDPETGEPHLAHKIACDMMLLEHMLAKHGNDNRGVRQYIPSHVPGTLPVEVMEALQNAFLITPGNLDRGNEGGSQRGKRSAKRPKHTKLAKRRSNIRRGAPSGNSGTPMLPGVRDGAEQEPDKGT